MALSSGYSMIKKHTQSNEQTLVLVFPDVSLLSAREFRTKFREQIANIIDPKSPRDNEPLEHANALMNTFHKVAEDWLELKKKTVKPATYNKAWMILSKHFFPFIGDLPVRDIKTQPVVEILKPIQAKGNIETLKRICRYINEVMHHAIAMGLVEVNPVRDVTKLFPPVKHKNMPSLRPEKLPEFMKALSNAKISTVTSYLVEWQLFTLTRPGEAAKTEWTEIDWERRIWVIPAHKMKKKAEHIVPLTQQMISLLKFMQPISGNDQYVFPFQRGMQNTHINTQTGNMAIKRMGFAGELLAHGLRALASTTLHEKDFNSELIEMCLSHVDSNSSRAPYNRAELVEKKKRDTELVE